MSNTFLLQENKFSLSDIPFETAVTNKALKNSTASFDKLVFSYFLFNIISAFVVVVELTLLLLFITFLMKSALLAFTLAIFLLTIFSYCIIRINAVARKPDQFEQIIDAFLAACPNNQVDHRTENLLAQAHFCTKFADHLKGHETNYFLPPRFLKRLTPYLRWLSSTCYWQDVHRMRELLLAKAIKAHIDCIKLEPTSLSAHAALANSYVMFSSLYVEPYPFHFFFKNLQREWSQKFRAISEKAIEEFKILHNFSPDDPWVYEQLAYSYRDLNMPQEEIQAYEALARFNPNSAEILFKLGVRYFQRGNNAEGLRTYEQLRRVDRQRSEELIAHYGVHDIL